MKSETIDSFGKDIAKDDSENSDCDRNGNNDDGNADDDDEDDTWNSRRSRFGMYRDFSEDSVEENNGFTSAHSQYRYRDSSRWDSVLDDEDIFRESINSQYDSFDDQTLHPVSTSTPYSKNGRPSIRGNGKTLWNISALQLNITSAIDLVVLLTRLTWICLMLAWINLFQTSHHHCDVMEKHSTCSFTFLNSLLTDFFFTV